MRECRFLTEDPEGKPVSKKGKFHQWGYVAYEYKNHGVMQTMAIVEDETGQICMIPPNDIRFIDESL